MGEISPLRASVLAQAQEKGRRLLAEAKAQTEQETQERKAALLQEKQQQCEQRLREIKGRFQRESQQLEHQKRQSVLAAKQSVLKEVFEQAYQTMAAWPVEKEQSFLETVLDKYTAQPLLLEFGALSRAKYSPEQLAAVSQKYPVLTIAETVLSGQAGFVLHQGRIDDNYLYRDLIASLWEEESYQIAQELFGDAQS